MKKLLLLIHAVAVMYCPAVHAQGGWQAISNFGSNPGNLNAYSYAPSNMPPDAPLVVVMHGCTQNATGFSNQTGWNTLADFHKFFVVHAEQKSANHPSNCFNYWEPGDHNRGQGEARSIKQMTDYMKSNYSIDSNRVFATGLSAGGAMTAVMLSAYPEVFAAGAEMAGLPYKVATNSTGVYTAALGLVSKSPQEWGDLVRAQNPGYTGAYPRLAIFHGTSDFVINENNAHEMMKQFTNLHGANQTADVTDNAFNGNSSVKLERYNKSGQPVVERYTISNMAHGIAVGPGNCYEQGGVAGSNSIDVGFYSSFWAAQFFGILRPPFDINGPDTVLLNQAGVSYSVDANAGSSHAWQVTGGTITSGQGTSAITVEWTGASGTVSLTETGSNGCDYGPVELPVHITLPVDSREGVGLTGEKILLYQNGRHIEFAVQSGAAGKARVCISDMSGREVYGSELAFNENHIVNKELPPGMYFMQCATGERILVKKIMIN